MTRESTVSFELNPNHLICWKLKQVVRDLHEEAWVEVWFLEELVQKAQFSDRIFLELLTNATAKSVNVTIANYYNYKWLL